MKFLMNIAFKNMFRNKLRTIVSILAIAFAVMVIVFTRGLIDGMVADTYELYIHYDTGHIKIIDEEYAQKERLLSLNYTVNGIGDKSLTEMQSDLEELQGIEMVIPRLKFGAAVSTEEELVQMLAWGVNSEKELAFTNLARELSQGRMVEAGNREVVMGTRLLEKINRSVGEKVTMVYTTAFSSFQGATFEIVGEITSNLPLLNEDVVFMPIDTARQLLYLEEESTELLLVGENRDQAETYLPAVQNYLEQNGGEKYLAQSWRGGSSFIQLLEVSETIYNFVYLFLVLLASIVVINTLVMIVKERTQEIGMMSALGLKSSEIMQLFILEGTAMALIGSLAGAIGGGIINYYLAGVGFDYSAAFQDVDILMNPIIYPTSKVEHMLFGFAIGVVVTTITAIIPARRAAKLEPTEALREI
ncbi:putative ABC transport system permease protein [Halanaerobium saccharolyticum]|jgi:putative ABC transport system permease protein|uniref:Putative ABC transport system permease protein n=1 Tax=Halanaerobium saccharolyticum TaxID=43595 RepID=A0A4V3G531_9FIRM|nr:FtsX-like permease family protein [Halanaerobium saccharolyticum]RAK07516.1 putative ABC transport system permease protein [Halanaerobium saccharolyticum]TDW03093.1 putative ABC transport system permease protein [Halanaerobium saccharolyticum]TDX59389.1 putative ABC transport system permease protein [Halanaerobium saccharolyticum]